MQARFELGGHDFAFHEAPLLWHAAMRRRLGRQMTMAILTPSRISGQRTTARMAERIAPMVPTWSKKWCGRRHDDPDHDPDQRQERIHSNASCSCLATGDLIGFSRHCITSSCGTRQQRRLADPRSRLDSSSITQCTSQRGIETNPTARGSALRRPPRGRNLASMYAPAMAKSREEHIRAGDGHEFTGYLTLPTAGSGAGMVVVQEIFGVTDYIKDVCARLSRPGVRCARAGPVLEDRRRVGHR